MHKTRRCSDSVICVYPVNVLERNVQGHLSKTFINVRVDLSLTVQCTTQKQNKKQNKKNKQRNNKKEGGGKK